SPGLREYIRCQPLAGQAYQAPCPGIPPPSRVVLRSPGLRKHIRSQSLAGQALIHLSFTSMIFLPALLALPIIS
ncbi:hypothetical protein ACF8O5_23615, partial [Raoultella sp. TYF_8]|uniref:hypothetical protein n=1 Tax=Raoultella sp. TYF_8 TaxID=3367188 RepID=UPI003709CE03